MRPSGRGCMGRGPPCWNSRRLGRGGPSQFADVRSSPLLVRASGPAGPAQWGEECVERLHGRRVDIDALLQAERHRVQAKTKEGHSRGGADGATGFRTSRRSWRLNSAGAQRPPTLLGQQRLALPCSGCCKEQVKELQRTLKDPYRNPRLRFSA